jgi:hypothetical protein
MRCVGQASFKARRLWNDACQTSEMNRVLVLPGNTFRIVGAFSYIERYVPENLN